MVEKIFQETYNYYNKWHIVTNGKTKQTTTKISNNSGKKDISKNITTKTSPKNKTLTPKKLAVNTNTREQKVAALKIKQQKENNQQTQLQNSKCFPAVGNTKAIQQQVRRRRSNQQEIRQIKRAHRHLLTSGGNDKQQKKKTNCQNNSCSPSSSSSSSTSSSALKKTEKKLKLSSGNNKNFSELNNNKKLLKQHKIKTNKNEEQASKQKKISPNSCVNKQQKKLKTNKFNDQESIISSRWCSIEEQLDLLEKLLYYCDEEENAALKTWYESINKKHYFDKDSSCGEEEPDSLSECDWSWSDIMSSSSSAAAYAANSQLATQNEDAQSTISNNSLTSLTSSCTSSLLPSSLKRRGHQHHPRFSGTRRPNVPPNVQQILAALYKSDETNTSSIHNDYSTNLDTDNIDDSYTHHYTDEPEDDPITAQRIKASLNLPLTESVTTSMGSNSPTPTDDSSMLDEGVVSAQTPTSAASYSNQQQQQPKEKKSKSKRDKSDKTESNKDKKSKKSKKDKSKRSSACLESTDTLNDAASAATDEGIAIDDDDGQSAEWAKLRCTSEAAEIVAEREARRNKNRCADYPGLAFGRSIFSSDTMMKFNIIRNELHNIMNTQLKRVNGKIIILF